MSLEQVAKLFPQIEARTVIAIEDGWDSLVLDVDDEWIVRIPRRPQVQAWLEMEARLLPELAPTLPAPIPYFEHVAEDGVRAVAYRKLRGSPLDVSRPRLGDQTGRFLAALHAFPVERARELGAPSHDRDWRDRYQAFANDLLGRARHSLGEDRPTAEAMFDSYFGEDDNFDFTPCLIHSDLGPAHMLAIGEELTGVLDWSDARIGDPAYDFSWLLHATPRAFAEALLGAYASDDPSLRDRALFFHRLGPWHELHYGLYFDRPAFVESGLAGIRDRLPRRIP